MPVVPESLNIDLTHGSKKHEKILNAVMSRFNLSDRNTSTQREKYATMDDIFRAYIPKTDADKLRETNRKSGGQEFITLEIPYSYAILLSAHTYWTSVFLSRAPVFQYSGRHGEGEQSTQAVEALMDYQVQVGKMLVPLYIWLMDPGKYGVGIVGNYWAEEKIRVSNIELVDETYLGEPTGKKVKKRVVSEATSYSGNKLYNIRPHDFYPDPRVPLAQASKGEFWGRKVDLGWNTLVKGAASGEYFNLPALKVLLGKNDAGADSVLMSTDESVDVTLPKDAERSATGQDIPDVGFTDLIEMEIEIIPKDWGLGESDFPEIWIFTIAKKKIIIKARPAGYYHGRFNFYLNLYEEDTYSSNPRSMLELLEPLGDTLNWLINTHFYNVRSSINNNWIYDPSRVVSKDVTRKGSEGKMIRLKESAYGTDVRSAITQLQVTDVTQGHLRDMQLVTDMMQRVSGVTDNIMGMVNAGGRKTATEIRTSSTFGINRLKTTAEFWSAGDWSSLAQAMLQNTQQFYSGEKKFRIVGDIIGSDAEPFRSVTHEDIAGFYDFVPVDGTLPVDRFAQANLWKEILTGMRNMPEVAGKYDMGGIFAWMAQLAGLKNIKQFKINVVPDAAIQGQVASGQSVPVGGSDVQNLLDQQSGAGTVGNVGRTG